jgi:hypothetical protein
MVVREYQLEHYDCIEAAVPHLRRTVSAVF